MKNILILLLCACSFLSCKNDKKTDAETVEQENELTVLKGEFIYYADAAVLQTPTEVYAVIIDKKMHELNEQVKKYKILDTDMVPVEVRGKISPKPENEEGWPFRIEIKEILKVSKPKPEDNNVVKLGN